MRKIVFFFFCTVCSVNGVADQSTIIKKIDLLANFNVRDLFVFPEELKKKDVDLSVNNTIPEIAQVFLDSSKAEKVIVFNWLFEKEVLSMIPKEKLIYFLWEPWEVPYEYYQSYKRVYTWNDDLVDNVKFFKIHYPSLMAMETELVPFKNKKFCVMVAGTDVDPKARNNDLYSERVRMVDFFETKPKGELEIYGRNWKSRQYRDYIGEIPGFHSGPEKISTLKKYRFSICFENTKNINGYVTEKIFCCFAAGCVPVYWGAKNIETYIPKRCYVDYRDFDTREDLYQFLKNMKKETYEQYLVNIRNFLNSKEAQVFSPAYFQKQFEEVVLQPL